MEEKIFSAILVICLIFLGLSFYHIGTREPPPTFEEELRHCLQTYTYEELMFDEIELDCDPRP